MKPSEMVSSSNSRWQNRKEHPNRSNLFLSKVFNTFNKLDFPRLKRVRKPVHFQKIKYINIKVKNITKFKSQCR